MNSSKERLERHFITHIDRLLRFGVEPVFSICEATNVVAVMINQDDDVGKFEEDDPCS